MSNESFSDLKPGEQVMVVYRNGQVMRSVQKITPSGFIKVDGTLYNKDGSVRSSDPFDVRHLARVTDERYTEYIHELKVKKAIKILREFPVDRIDVRLAEKIIKNLGEYVK